MQTFRRAPQVYRPEEVAGAVEACPSMEVVDTRFDTQYRTIRQRLNERATLVEAYADHITNGAFIIGQGLKNWRDIDFGAMRGQDERRRQADRRNRSAATPSSTRSCRSW